MPLYLKVSVINVKLLAYLGVISAFLPNGFPLALCDRNAFGLVSSTQIDLPREAGTRKVPASAAT